MTALPPQPTSFVVVVVFFLAIGIGPIYAQVGIFASGQLYVWTGYDSFIVINCALSGFVDSLGHLGLAILCKVFFFFFFFCNQQKKVIFFWNFASQFAVIA